MNGRELGEECRRRPGRRLEEFSEAEKRAPCITKGPGNRLTFREEIVECESARA
jgi:hypothetical protein